MNVQSRGYVDPSRWDDGVPAAFVDYYFSGAQIKNADEGRAAAQTISIYAAASTRAPGDCATSPQCSMTSSAGTGIPRARLQRDVRSLKSLLRIGDTYTTGDVFDSIQFRGVQLMSDDEMLPDSQRGFAPLFVAWRTAMPK